MADNEDRTGSWGDKSGKGRVRKDDSEFPKGRDADEMGIHGGAKKNAGEEQPDKLPIPSQS